MCLLNAKIGWKALALLAVAAVLITSCKKPDDADDEPDAVPPTFTVEGIAVDSLSGQPAPDLCIKLDKHFTQDCSLGPNGEGCIETIASQLTDENGQFSFEVDANPETPADMYWLATCGGTQGVNYYYSSERAIGGSELEGGQIYTIDFSALSHGRVDVQIVNSSPYDNTDHICAYTFNAMWPDDNCIPNLFGLTGSTIDETYPRDAIGNDWLQIRWQVEKNGQVTNGEDSIFVSPQDVLNYTIAY